MAKKQGIIETTGIFVGGVLDIRDDTVFVEYEGETKNLAEILKDYDGCEFEIKSSK